jgi:hypothetical protein
VVADGVTLVIVAAVSVLVVATIIVHRAGLRLSILSQARRLGPDALAGVLAAKTAPPQTTPTARPLAAALRVFYVYTLAYAVRLCRAATQKFAEYECPLDKSMTLIVAGAFIFCSLWTRRRSVRVSTHIAKVAAAVVVYTFLFDPITDMSLNLEDGLFLLRSLLSIPTPQTHLIFLLSVPAHNSNFSFFSVDL